MFENVHNVSKSTNYSVVIEKGRKEGRKEKKGKERIITLVGWIYRHKIITELSMYIRKYDSMVPKIKKVTR